ncbi:hypothetical protein HDU93_001457, partial [Gonapodya sp. JEL0774]
MLIKPVDAPSEDDGSGVWHEHARDPYGFSLQSKSKSDVLTALVKGFATIGRTQEAKTAWDYDFRIVLADPSSNLVNIVAIADTMDAIRTDWHFCQQRVLPALMNRPGKTTQNTILEVLEAVAGNLTFVRIPGKPSQLLAQHDQIMRLFPGVFESQVVLNCFSKGSKSSSSLALRGTALLLPFSDVLGLDSTTVRKGIPPLEGILMTTKEATFVFSFPNDDPREVLRVVTSLSDSAMHRLANESAPALPITPLPNPADPVIEPGTSPADASAGAVDLGGDVSEMLRASNRGKASWSEGSGQASRDNPNRQILQRPSVVGDSAERTSPGRNSQLEVVNTVEDLEIRKHTKNILAGLRLPAAERIAFECVGSYHYSPTVDTIPGVLLALSSFVSFLSAAVVKNFEGSGAPGVIYAGVDADKLMTFCIPYSLITSVTKRPPTTLPPSFNTSLTSFSLSLSGYVVITTRTKVEFWMSFPSQRSRDQVNDIILERLKSVTFDPSDWVIGGSPLGVSSRKSGGGSPTSPTVQRTFEAAEADAETLTSCGLSQLFPLTERTS